MGKEENSRRINDRFRQLKRTKDETIQKGLRNLLIECMSSAFAFHDAKHQNHIVMGDNYGWAIVKDGVEVERQVHSSERTKARADRQLSEVIGRTRRIGWVGILMAGMQPANFYAVDYEVNVLQRVIATTDELFNKYFKKL